MEFSTMWDEFYDIVTTIPQWICLTLKNLYMTLMNFYKLGVIQVNLKAIYVLNTSNEFLHAVIIDTYELAVY